MDPLGVLLAAACMRGIFAWETRRDPLFSILVVDARSYFERALRFAGGDHLFGTEPLWFAPLHAVLLGGLFSVVGPEAGWARLIQFGMGAATAALGAVLGGRISRAAGLTAGLLLALAPVPIFYEGQLLYTSLAVFLTALFLERYLAALAAGGSGRFAAAGVCLGLLGLVRSNALLFLPVACLVLLRKARLRGAIALAAGTLALLVPVLLRNGLVSGTWTPLTVNGGMVFATGFAPDSRGGRSLLRRPEDFGPGGAYHREAERALGRPVSLAEASRYHRGQALGRIASDPGWAAGLTLRKLRLLVTSREIDDNLGFPLVRDRSRVLSWLPVPWAWLVLPAFLGGAAWARRRGPDGEMVRALILYSATYSASLLLFFVNARYRLPLAVPAAVLAGAAVEAIRAARARGELHRLAVPGAVAAALAVPVLASPGVRADPALGLLSIGAALEREGRHAEALALADRSIDLDPRVAGSHHNRAVSLLALGRTGEAVAAAETASRLDPGAAGVWSTLGAALARDGRLEEAVPAFRKAVALDPGGARGLENLARALWATERREEAVETARKAVAEGSRRLSADLEEWEALTGQQKGPTGR